MSLSILGVEPLDEFIKDIADFVCHMIMTRPEGLDGAIEVEAKVGLLKEKGYGGQRMDVRFESNMSVVRPLLVRKELFLTLADVFSS